ncbi:hypothetical protein FQ192_31025 [Pseudomonas sp. ANT_J12]|uniref:Uncharacterized protein n=1 Tax=Pseudomonas prosekii TaxID=1148509 RepID=A0A2U2D090_9PSED|nr:hypothetical protein FQ192_31025 [Pseudomonas sp. ANT_J12]PWE38775.1 hypothetical protein C9I49_27425 [Pseudomonas prosekii]
MYLPGGRVPITAYLRDVFISSYSAIGIVFGHERVDQFGRFEDGHLMSTSHIRFAQKEGRFWVLTTMRSRYVVASFKKDVGRATLKTFLRAAPGRYIFTPPVLQ